MKSNGKKLIDTNPYLKDRRQCAEMLLRNASASCHIEGVYCRNLDSKLRQSTAPRRKSRSV
ncbi:MAG: hypothetical protein V1701_01515 [Planctomycetota bacterium]